MAKVHNALKAAAKAQLNSEKSNGSKLYQAMQVACYNEADSMGLDREIYHEFKYQTSSMNSWADSRREANCSK